MAHKVKNENNDERLQEIVKDKKFDAQSLHFLNLSPRSMDSLLVQLQTSGVQFSIKFLGWVGVSSLMSKEERSEYMQSTISRFANKACLTKEDGEQNSDSEAHRKMNVYNSYIDINISSTDIIMIDTSSFPMKILHRFKICNVSSVSTSKNLGHLFCFIAKEDFNLTHIPTDRKCFVFDANDLDEMEEICEAIGFAFRIQELNNKTITNKPVNLRDADLPIHCSTTPFISPSVLDVFVTQSDIEKSSDKSNNSVSRRNAEKNEPENSYRRETRSKSPNLPESNSRELSSQLHYKHLTKDLTKYCWYHQTISREDAIALIKRNGEFLVRPSETLADQIVLTGMHEGIVKHIGVIGMDSKISSTVGEFHSVAHFINYYYTSKQPLISHGIVLVLSNPIARKTIN